CSRVGPHRPCAVGRPHGAGTSAFDAAGTDLADPAPPPPEPPRSGEDMRMTLAWCLTTSAATAGSRRPETSLITRAPASSAARADAARAVSAETGPGPLRGRRPTAPRGRSAPPP